MDLGKIRYTFQSRNYVTSSMPEQHIYATEGRIKDNYAFDHHSDTHICERNLGELNDLRGKILINIKGGTNA